jgi:hypothetical protein
MESGRLFSGAGVLGVVDVHAGFSVGATGGSGVLWALVANKLKTASGRREIRDNIIFY